MSKDKHFPFVAKAPKRRNVLAVVARKRKAGALVDKRSSTNCSMCGDRGFIVTKGNKAPCPRCQYEED